MAEGTQQNDEAVEKYIRSLYDTWRSEEQPVQQHQQTQPNQSVEQQHQLVRELIDPVYGGQISSAHLKADAAQDESRFYRRNPEAITYEEDIERIFNDAIKNGRPTPRETIYDYMIGNMRRTKPDQFDEFQKKQLERARAAEDFGAGAGKTREGATLEDVKSMSLEDMEKNSEFMGLVF